MNLRVASAVLVFLVTFAAVGALGMGIGSSSHSTRWSVSFTAVCGGPGIPYYFPANSTTSADWTVTTQVQASASYSLAVSDASGVPIFLSTEGGLVAKSPGEFSLVGDGGPFLFSGCVQGGSGTAMYSVSGQFHA